MSWTRWIIAEGTESNFKQEHWSYVSDIWGITEKDVPEDWADVISIFEKREVS